MRILPYYYSGDIMNIILEINKRKQKRAIRNMKKACNDAIFLSNEKLDRVEYLALSVTDEEMGYYPQSPSAGRRIFVSFLIDEVEKDKYNDITEYINKKEKLYNKV